MNYVIYSNELYHHGVKGMKWGVRRQAQNANYSAQQRARDKEVYGRGGVRRINKRMNNGEKISTARSKEADRAHNFRRAAVVGGKVGAVAGGVAGAAAGKKVMDKIGSKHIPSEQTPAVLAGSASIGATLGRYGGQSIVMVVGGYKPSKFRYD